MKIALIITKAELGGAQSHLIELCNGLIDAGHSVTVCTGETGFLVEWLRSKNLDVLIIPELKNASHPLCDIKAVWKIRQWLKFEQPAILHAHSTKAGILGRVAARSLGIPSVFTAHGWAFTDGASWLRKLLAWPIEKAAARIGTAVICVSRYDYNLALKYRVVPECKMEVVWNGITDTDQIAIPGENRQLTIVMIARFAHPKDQEGLIKALSSVVATNWKLVFVGDGPELDNCVKQVTKLNLNERVVFAGMQADVLPYLRSADLFVLWSKYEGLPISIIEAMRSGLATIASDVGGVSELVTPTTGLVVPYPDTDSLAIAINNLITQPNNLSYLGHSARKYYLEYFKSERMVAKVISVYDRIA
jgi:glycosyltransferase involved in cell wall biosynthesis